MSKTEELLGSKDVAGMAGTDAKTLRKFLRAERPDMAPGQGGRWGLTQKDAVAIAEAFKARATESEAAGTGDSESPKPKRGKKAKAEPIVEEMDDDEIDALLDDVDPTDEELEDLEESLD